VKRNGCGNLRNGWLKMRLALKEVERWRVSESLFWVVELTIGILRFPWMKLGILVMIWFEGC